MNPHDIRLGALGFALLMILVAVMMRTGIIDNGDTLLTLLPALFVTTLITARKRGSCAKGC